MAMEQAQELQELEIKKIRQSRIAAYNEMIDTFYNANHGKEEAFKDNIPIKNKPVKKCPPTPAPIKTRRFKQLTNHNSEDTRSKRNLTEDYLEMESRPQSKKNLTALFAVKVSRNLVAEESQENRSSIETLGCTQSK